MLLRARFRRSRPTLLFACLLVLTAIVYATLNILNQKPNSRQQRQQQLQRGLSRDRSPTGKSMTVVAANISRRRPAVPVASLRLIPRSSLVQDTSTTSLASSPAAAASNATTTELDNDEAVDTGSDGGTVTIQPPGVEQRVRHEVTRLRLRPPRTVRYSHGQWQIVEVGRQVRGWAAIRSYSCSERLLTTFSARCNIYISRLCYDVSVCL